MKDRQEQNRRRRTERRRREQQGFTEQRTGKQARNTANAQTNLAYRPAERHLGREIRSSQMQQGRIGSWYDQFAQQLEASRAQNQAAYDAANTRIAGTMQQAGAADTQRQQGLQAEAAQRSAMTGAPADAKGAQQRTEAARQSGQFGAALAAPVIGQQANAFAYSTNQADISRRQGIAAKEDEFRRRQEMKGDLRALRKERGAYRVDKLNELRGAEREYGIQLRAFPEAAAERRADAAEAARDRRFDANQAAKDRAQSERQDVRGNQDTGGGGLTPSQRRDIREGRRNAMAEARRAIKSAGTPTTAKEWADLQGALAGQGEISPEEARWAVQKLKRRYYKRIHADPSPQGPGR